MNPHALLPTLERIANALERLTPTPPPVNDWSSLAYRWRQTHTGGVLEGVPHPHQIQLEDLQNVAQQVREVRRNTAQFVLRKPANNVLLTGSRGTGKSSLVKAMLSEFGHQGLRLIEVEKTHLVALPEIVEQLYHRPERFLIFCDDLSFEAGDVSYQALKVALDGTVSAPAENVLIYATSNRRHLLPEYHLENAQTQHLNGEVHPSEAIEDKIALSERFGLWLHFYSFDQAEYLNIVTHWLQHFGVDLTPAARQSALNWATQKGNRSGRIAWQFARDWAGKHSDPA